MPRSLKKGPFVDLKLLEKVEKMRHSGERLLQGSIVDSADCLVILEFPTAAQAKTWLTSPEYAPARALRHKYARTNMVVVEGA